MNKLIIIDIRNTFEEINLDIVSKFLKEEKDMPDIVKKQWECLIKMYKNLGVFCDDRYFNKVSGVPQGSHIAPYISNYFISKIMRKIIDRVKIKDKDVKVYSDNIFILVQYEDVEIIISLIGRIFNEYGMDIHQPKVMEYEDFITFDKLDFYEELGKRNVNKSKINMYRILGINLYTIENMSLFLDTKSIMFKLDKVGNRYSPFQAFNFYQRNIVAKFRFYYNIVKIWNSNVANKYYNWFQNKTRNWLKEQTTIQKVSDDILKTLINIGKTDKKIESYRHYSKDFKNQMYTDIDMKTIIKTNRRMILEKINKWRDTYVSPIESLKQIFNEDTYIKQYKGNTSTRFYDYMIDKIYDNIMKNKNRTDIWINDKIKNKIGNY